jgi:hypothetical protein
MRPFTATRATAPRARADRSRPNGALQQASSACPRSGSRTTRDRRRVPITAHPRAARAVDAVAERPQLRGAESRAASYGAGVRRKALPPPEAAPRTDPRPPSPLLSRRVPPPTSDGPTVPLERVAAAPTATVPPPPPESPAPEARVRPEPAPAVAERRAEPAPAPLREAAPAPSRQTAAAATRDHPFVTERRDHPAAAESAGLDRRRHRHRLLDRADPARTAA